MDDERKPREPGEGVEGEARRRPPAPDPAEAELQRIREVLDMGAEALRVVLENSRDVVTILRDDASIGYISPSVERVAGHKPEDLIGTNAFDLIHPDDVDALMQAFSRGLESSRRAINIEFRYRHKDGSWHDMEAEGINLLGNSAVAGMVLTARDISERKKTEEALQQRESYFRSLIRNAGDMITILDQDLNFVWGSAGAARVTGYTADDIYGHNFLDYVLPEREEWTRDFFSSLLEEPMAARTLEGPFRHKDGSYHYHEAIVTNLLGDPSVRGIVINSRDINERQLMEERLRVSNRELDAFATIVSHDLRTPLSVIEGYAQLMRADSTTEEEREVYLKSIIAAARRMDELTESLLEYAQAGKAAGDAVRVDPMEVIADVLSELSDLIAEKDIDVVLAEEFPVIRVDPIKFRQVFTNLVNNAVKYAGDDPRPRIEVGAGRDGAEVVFHVRDNGEGLDPESREEVFLPFRRLGTPKTPGVGIGLFTVKRTVEAWGGRVWVESEPGRGTTFFFTAPGG
jgi:PAS domain S-box-containing protein